MEEFLKAEIFTVNGFDNIIEGVSEGKISVRTTVFDKPKFEKWKELLTTTGFHYQSSYNINHIIESIIPL